MPGHQGYSPIQQIDNMIESNRSGGGSSGLLPSTYSSQQLMPPDNDSVEVSEAGSERIQNSRLYAGGFAGSNTGGGGRGLRNIAARDWFTVGVLCFVNLINYMDRFTIAGVLTDIQSNFNIGDDQGGLLQTVFVLSYMVCAPIFGYLGDRYSRRLIMIVGVFLWSATTVIGSFMNNIDLFMTFRALVGIGEASYSTIAPTLISDLFVNDIRSKMLALFYFAIPVGSGLGYIVGSETARLAGSWRWALRVTPFLGALALIMLFLIKEPIRGQSEGSHHMETTSYKEDLKELVKNRSFMLSTCGFTCVAFVAGALAWWGPKFIHLGLKMQPGNENISLNDVSYKFGIVAMLSGLIGVPLGSFIAQRLRPTIPNVDPLICAWGLLISSPLVYFSLVVPTDGATLCFVFVFFAEVALNMSWSIVADILLYVVVPTRRSTAEAFQILISHAFGDAGSPYLVGVISEAIKSVLRKSSHTTTQTVNDGLQSLALTLQNSTQFSNTFLGNDEDTDKVKFQALQYSLFSTSFVEILGGVFFLITAIYILKDKNKASQSIKESQEVTPHHTYADASQLS